MNAKFQCPRGIKLAGQACQHQGHLSRIFCGTGSPRRAKPQGANQPALVNLLTTMQARGTCTPRQGHQSATSRQFQKQVTLQKTQHRRGFAVIQGHQGHLFLLKRMVTRVGEKRGWSGRARSRVAAHRKSVSQVTLVTLSPDLAQTAKGPQPCN